MSDPTSPSSATAVSSATADLEARLHSLGGQVAADLALAPKAETSARIAAAIAEIDLTDSQSIIFFGSKAQQQLTTVSDTMLEAVRGKDVGPAGQALGRMVAKLRELDFTSVDPNDKPGFLGRLLGLKSEVMKYVDQYQEVRDQIDSITGELEDHKTRLLTDIVKLDKLYDATLDYFRSLEVYIAAGRAKLEQLDAGIIPELASKAEQSTDVVEAQGLRDLRSARDDLERRVHDLLLTRQVTMQSLPSIRLVQENDKSLVTKINSTIANTVPLWRQQLAQAITVFRAGQAAEFGEGGERPHQRSAAQQRRAAAAGQRQGPRAGRARRVRSRRRQAGQRAADRHDRGFAAHRRRGQGQQGRGGDAAGGTRRRAEEDADLGSRARHHPRPPPLSEHASLIE